MKALSEQMQALHKRLDALEAKKAGEKIDELKEEVSFLGDRQDSIYKDMKDRLDLNLYVTLEFENFDNTDASFDARNVELLIGGQISDRLKGYAEIEFERAAKTSARNRQGEIEIEQGWIEFAINEYFNPRMGVILVPFGRFNLEHFDPFRDLTDRPIVMRRVIPVTWAEAGAGFTGAAQIGDWMHWEALDEFNLSYQMFFVNGLTDRISDRGLRDAPSSWRRWRAIWQRMADKYRSISPARS